MDQLSVSPPKPFLHPVFPKGMEPTIATGFRYLPREVSLHGVSYHGGIDFDVPSGTPVLTAADGWAIALYGEQRMRFAPGTPRTLTPAEARRGNPPGTVLRPPDGASETQELAIYYGSYVVQIWHGHGRYTQYAHLEWTDPDIPYYAPVETDAHDLNYHPMLRAPVSAYWQHGAALRVKAGQQIGVTGMTGCGWGRRCYDDAKFDATVRPDFRGQPYTYYTGPHLHFMVLSARDKITREPTLWDPFGVYGQVQEGYPATRAEWARVPGSLWLPEGSFSPQEQV